MGRRAKSGKFSPKNADKYRGDPTNIYWRSSWELRCMVFFDKNPDILEWSSEEWIIPYYFPVDNKMHRYFPDFWARVKMKDGEIKEYLIEVKPHGQTLQPRKLKPGSRPTKRYLEEVETYIKNQSKWKASVEFCKQRDWTFQILTEKNVGFK